MKLEVITSAKNIPVGATVRKVTGEFLYKVVKPVHMISMTGGKPVYFKPKGHKFLKGKGNYYELISPDTKLVWLTDMDALWNISVELYGDQL